MTRTKVYSKPRAQPVVFDLRPIPDKLPASRGYVLSICIAILVAGVSVACLLHAIHPGRF